MNGRLIRSRNRASLQNPHRLARVRLRDGGGLPKPRLQFFPA